MTSVNDIRSEFLSFFKSRDHEIVPSSPLVPQNDPTLMFANSGMVQFKNLFTGIETRPYKRATTSQKCVRAGGKHNDLDNVGYTARHHVFFEMLGNFSFGDYFKEQAIDQAWTLITKNFALPKDKLLVTIYKDDEEAAILWRKIAGLPDERIIRIATSDNFWSMGATGPCGPCSEIFYDHGEDIAGGPPGSPDEDGDRFIEIWNLVFMQYEQTESERLPLPSPSIDTGMGLERIAAVLQGKHDNYDIDLIRALIEASAHISNTEADGSHNVSHRVVADHLRASGFLIADGVLPSNEGRGYVLRRIMRRAMRHLHQLGCEEPVMHKLVPALTREMGGHYPELIAATTLISETLRLEEARFKEALARGLKLLNAELEGKASGGILAGATAFKLYDTYGFPLDLTQDYLRGYGWQVDHAGFDEAMKRQKQIARTTWTGSGEKADDRLMLELAQKHGETEFLGYKQLQTKAKITDLICQGKSVDYVSAGDHFMFTTDQTVFYGESGGQIGDRGRLICGLGKATIRNTTKIKGLVIHHAKLQEGNLSLRNDREVTLEVDSWRRSEACAHHSATHLLHGALRQILGDHVVQKGSLVTRNRLRFDFSHLQAVTKDELKEIEDVVNERIRMDSEVSIIEDMTIDEAKAKGALALFGEKYGDKVRVVSMGGASSDSMRSAWSVELCGGTHVSRTSQIRSFDILRESSVASGVRRIEAVCHRGTKKWLENQVEESNKRVTQLLKDYCDLRSQLLSLLEKLMLVSNAEQKNKYKQESAHHIALDLTGERSMVERRMEEELSDLHQKFVSAINTKQERREQDVRTHHESIRELGKNLLQKYAEYITQLLEDKRNMEKKIASLRQKLSIASPSVQESEQINELNYIAQFLPDTPPRDLKPMADNLRQNAPKTIICLTAAFEGKASIVIAVSDDLTSEFDAVVLVKHAATSIGGTGGGGRPDLAQAGGPDAEKAEQAINAVRAILHEKT